MKLLSSLTFKKSYERPSCLRPHEYDEWDSRFMLRTDQDDFGVGYNDMWGQKGWFKPSCIPITIILLLIFLVVLLPLLDAAEKQHRNAEHNLTLIKCEQSCNLTLIETIPEGMSYRNGSTPFPSTFNLWMEMIAKANSTIEIASFYWTLRDGDVKSYPGTEKGEAIFSQLLSAGKDRGLTVKIVQSQPTRTMPDIDTEILARKRSAEVRSINMAKLVGGGILHTKLWITDRSSAYIGSANTDWRSLSQVKELGVFISNCTCLVEDIAKIFDVYWEMALPDSQIPPKWPDNLSTEFNGESPMLIIQNNTRGGAYISSSPPQLCPSGRESDINSILSAIHKADKFVYIAVMDYVPLTVFTAKPRFWPVIDDTLRSAAVDRKVEVRLLISYWNYSHPYEKLFLKSLAVIDQTFKNVKISIKLFIVPSTAAQSKIPHARVNHNKYMVTDNTAYIGTSNWSGDYFTNTGGMALILEGNTSLRLELETVFLRDWNSEFAYPLPK